MKKIALTGGEVTTHPDFIRIVELLLADPGYTLAPDLRDLNYVFCRMDIIIKSSKNYCREQRNINTQLKSVWMVRREYITK